MKKTIPSTSTSKEKVIIIPHPTQSTGTKSATADTGTPADPQSVLPEDEQSDAGKTPVDTKKK